MLKRVLVGMLLLFLLFVGIVFVAANLSEVVNFISLVLFEGFAGVNLFFLVLTVLLLVFAWPIYRRLKG